MQINHVALYVTDLERAKDFFIRYFQASPNTGYHNPSTGLQTYFLTFSDGATLELMKRPQLEDSEKHLLRTGFIHIAFSTGSPEAVDKLTARLQRDGYQLINPPRTTGDGYYESCILDAEGNQIEIIA